MKSLFALTFVAASAFANAALAQDVAAVKSEKNPPLRHTTIEIRPVDSLISATPGIAAGGGSVEAYLGHNWAVAVGGSYANVNLPQKYVGTVNDKRNAALVNKGYAFSTGAGVRYYDAPFGDSLYGGMDVDYSEVHTGWKYKDDTVTATRFAVAPALVAGYRFVWDSGFVARLGAGASLPSVQSQKVTADTQGPNAAQAQRKVEDTLNRKVLAKLDLGVGVMF